MDNWVERKTGIAAEEIYKALWLTRSYIAGSGLYELLTRKNGDNDLEIYTNKEGAKIFTLQFGDQVDITQYIPLKPDRKFEALQKNGITSSCIPIGKNVIIHICRDPYHSVNNLIINHHQVYFDGIDFNVKILEEAPKLNDLYVEDYIAFNPYINKQIADFVANNRSLYIDGKDRPIGVQRVYSILRAEKHELYRYLTYFIYSICTAFDFEKYQYVKIDTVIFDYTFDELVDCLNRTKDKSFPEVYKDDVKKFIQNSLLDIYEFNADMRPVIKNYAMDYFGLSIEELNATNVQLVPGSSRYEIKQKINRLKDLAILKDNVDSLNRMTIRNRTMRNLEFFTKPSSDPVEEVNYNETSQDKCIDLESFSYYDINSYLRGEAVMAYGEDGLEEKDYALEAVSPDIARKRIVFFVASDKEITRIKPFCYNLDLLEKDFGTRIYSETCGSNGGMGDIHRGFSNPIFKLPFETNVYVRVSKLLKALYNTKSQAFLLIPTDQIIPRTASLSTAVYNLGVSGDHCQGGTDKRLYRIVVCGKGGDKCYPLREDIEFRPELNLTRTSDVDYGRHVLRYREEIEAAQYEQQLLAEEEF